jgi:ArsR family transcriptional regulator
MAKKAAVGGKSELIEWARGFSLLSDPTRLGILKLLSAGPKNVTGLCDALDLKQPTISHHLGLLRMGRLVVGTRQGKSVVYVADADNLKDLAVGLAKLTPSK